MTDARFLSNNSVTSEANHAKCKTVMQNSWAYKSPEQLQKSVKGFARAGRLFIKKWIFFAILGAAFPPPGTDWREISLSQADPRVPWLCQILHESVQRVETAAGRKC